MLCEVEDGYQCDDSEPSICTYESTAVQFEFAVYSIMKTTDKNEATVKLYLKNRESLPSTVNLKSSYFTLQQITANSTLFVIKSVLYAEKTESDYLSIKVSYNASIEG